jgi:hypothetical protein
MSVISNISSDSGKLWTEYHSEEKQRNRPGKRIPISCQQCQTRSQEMHVHQSLQNKHVRFNWSIIFSPLLTISYCI